jgi:chaperonin GroES
MKIEMLHDNVLVREEKRATTTPGGIHIPDTARPEAPVLIGEVIDVGPGRYDSGRFVETHVRRGNRVAYQRYVGREIEIDGVTYVVLAERDVLGRLAAE